MANLTNARIDQLPLNAVLKAGYWGVLRNMDNGVTERFDLGQFLTSTTTGNFEYNGGAYNELDAVTWKGQWYQALENVPAGIVPGTDSTYWNLITKSASGLVFWKAGVFPQDYVFVLYDVNENPSDPLVKFFILRNMTRPFVSTDFMDELANGDWEEFLVSAIGGIDLGDLFPNTYFVSPLGNDATGEQGNLSKPYTPAGAVALAGVGDKITFLPGYYNIDYTISKDGVSYTTFAGDVVIEITGINTVLFNYEPSASFEPISISGLFYYKLNGVGCSVFKFNDALANYRSHYITWVLMQCYDGAFGIIFPRFSTSALFDGQIDVDAAYTGFAMSTPLSANYAGSRGGKVDIRINNMSSKPGFAAASFSGYIVSINYYSNNSLAGFSDGFSVVQDCVWTLNIVQNSGCTSKMPSGGTFNCNLSGGSYDFRGAAKLQVDGYYKNATLLFNVTDGVYLSGRLDTCYVFSNSDKLVISGESNDTIIEGNSLVLYGLHIGMFFGVNSRVGKLKVLGTIIFKVGAFIAFDGSAFMEVGSSGKIIGDYNGGPFINMRTQPGNKLVINGGQIWNKGATVPVIGFIDSGNMETVILKGAVLVSSGPLAIDVGGSSLATLKIMGNSYMNVGIGGAGIGTLITPIDSTASLIVDADVEILDF